MQVWAAQLPGRADRLGEGAISSLPALVDALADELLPHLDVPCAFFGHSMGAVVAFETAHALVSRGAPGPRYLIASGRRPPDLQSEESLLHILPDAMFVDEVHRRYGGIPLEVLHDRELRELVLPALRADITALETSRYRPHPLLSCPIYACGGAQDRLVPRAHLEAWGRHTKGPFRVRTYAGGHFYIVDQCEALLADLSTVFAPMLRPVSSLEVVQ